MCLISQKSRAQLNVLLKANKDDWFFCKCLFVSSRISRRRTRDCGEPFRASEQMLDSWTPVRSRVLLLRSERSVHPVISAYSECVQCSVQTDRRGFPRTFSAFS